MEDLGITTGLIAQVGENENTLMTFDLLEHDAELQSSDVPLRWRLFFAWANYYHWCDGMGVRGQANMIEGWLKDRLWGNDSNDWHHIRAFCIDTAEYCDEFSYFELKSDDLNQMTFFRRSMLVQAYADLGIYIRDTLGEVAPEDAFLVEFINVAAQFWVEWWAENGETLQAPEGIDVSIQNTYDAIQGNLRELTIGNSDAALDETYALKA